MWYPDRIPDWFCNLFTGYYWHGDRELKTVYLTFDDGPTPMVTTFVLEQLQRVDFKATFFLIGDRVSRHQNIKEELLLKGHRIGNHTHNHLNAWKTSVHEYIENVEKATSLIDSTLFRPPYGKIKPSISRKLRDQGFKMVLWDVLSGDFDTNRPPTSCLASLKKNTKNGSIIVFHDSEKAAPILKEILPEYLDWLKNKGYCSKAIA